MKHADETTWSCDGKNGYAWGFFTPTVSLYRLRGTRGSVVAKEVFGNGPHIGVLGVDRYAAYGKTWLGAIQYCLEHYKRNVGDLLEAEPENKEYKKHIPKFIDLLKEAMTLRSRFKGDEYNEESRRIRDEIQMRLRRASGGRLRLGVRARGFADRYYITLKPCPPAKRRPNAGPKALSSGLSSSLARSASARSPKRDSRHGRL